MKWINCNDPRPIKADAVCRRIGYTDTIDRETLLNKIGDGREKAIEWEWLDESPTPSASIQEAAKEYADKVYPYVWPKNKKGEEIEQRVGQNPPNSAKHRREQQKIIDAYLKGHSEASAMKDQEHPLVEDGVLGNYSITDIAYMIRGASENYMPGKETRIKQYADEIIHRSSTKGTEASTDQSELISRLQNTIANLQDMLNERKASTGQEGTVKLTDTEGKKGGGC